MKIGQKEQLSLQGFTQDMKRKLPQPPHGHVFKWRKTIFKLSPDINHHHLFLQKEPKSPIFFSGGREWDNLALHFMVRISILMTTLIQLKLAKLPCTLVAMLFKGPQMAICNQHKTRTACKITCIISIIGLDIDQIKIASKRKGLHF